jgi:hypothetical protein
MDYKKILFGVIISNLLLSEVVFAAIEWPSIGGISLTNNSSFAEAAGYLYVFIAAIGVSIAVIVIIMAGIDFLIHGSNPSEISKARNKVLGAIIGILFLVSPYIIIKIINPDINKTTSLGMSCDNMSDCIVRKIKKTITTVDDKGKQETKIEETEKEEMAPSSETSINRVIKTNNSTIVIEQKITIKKYIGLQAVIGFSGENFTGTAFKIFSDNPENDDLNKPLQAPIAISGCKSYKIIKKRAGIWFYGGISYNVFHKEPLLEAESVNNLEAVLGDEDFYSIDIVNPWKSKNYDYIGLLFAGNDFRMTCSPFYKDTPLIDGSLYNSVKILKRDRDYLIGKKMKLVLFNNVSCSEQGAVLEKKDNSKEKTAELRKCEITLINNDDDIETATAAITEQSCVADKSSCKGTINSVATINNPQKIREICKNFNGEDITSFRIDSSMAAIVFLSSNKLCDYWDLNRLNTGDEVCNAVNAAGASPYDEFKPDSFFVIPFGHQ